MLMKKYSSFYDVKKILFKFLFLIPFSSWFLVANSSAIEVSPEPIKNHETKLTNGFRMLRLEGRIIPSSHGYSRLSVGYSARLVQDPQYSMPLTGQRVEYPTERRL